MDKNELIKMDVSSLVKLLGDKDGVIRQHAREELVRREQAAVNPLMEELLNSKSEQVRWEAAKALGDIHSSDSIPALVQALSDSDFDVAWLAAEGLKKFQKAAWPSLLHALVEKKKDAGALHQGAHHVLSDQKDEELDDLLSVLLKDLEMGGLSESAIVAAHELLERMKNQG